MIFELTKSSLCFHDLIHLPPFIESLIVIILCLLLLVETLFIIVLDANADEENKEHDTYLSQAWNWIFHEHYVRHE